MSADDPKRTLRKPRIFAPLTGILLIETIKRWYKIAPAPVIWLAAALFLFAWLILISAVFSILNGGYQQLASHLPQYAYQVGLKLAGLYLVALAAYLLVQLIALIRR